MASNSLASRSDGPVVIVGGGVIGVCCAYYLAKRGARVIVLERDEIGKAASYGNAGSIAPGHTPINKPGRIKQALKSLFDPLSPLYVAPRVDAALVRWLWEFRRTCTEEHVEYSMRTLGPLGHMTRELFLELAREEKLECGLRPEGYFEVYLTDRGWQSAKKESAVVAQHGFHPEAMPGGALAEQDPAFSSQMAGGIFYPEAITVNPYLFVSEMAKRAAGYGAEFRTGVEVLGVRVENRRTRGAETRDGLVEADSVVLAGGAYCAAMVRRLGFRFPLQAAKGYHRDCTPGEGRPPLLNRACILGENMVFCTPMDGFVRFAGTLEFSGVNHEIRRPRLEQLTNAASRYFTTMNGAQVRSEWCGLRPCLPDGLPAVGPLAPYAGLFVAGGHAMMGLTLGPVTGKLIAENILDGAASMDISAMNPARF